MKKYIFRKAGSLGTGFYFGDDCRLMAHNADGIEWYRAEDVDKRIAELEAEVESDNRELDMAWDSFNRKEAENAALRKRIAELEAKYDK